MMLAQWLTCVMLVIWIRVRAGVLPVILCLCMR